MKHDGGIADHRGSAARRHRRGGNATTCLGPRMPPTISLRRAEFYVARTTGRLTGSPRGWAMSSVRPLTPENRSAGSSSTFWPLAPRTPTISRGESIMRAGPSFQATGACGAVWATRRSPRAFQRPRDRWAHHTGCSGGAGALHGPTRRPQREIWCIGALSFRRRQHEQMMISKQYTCSTPVVHYHGYHGESGVGERLRWQMII